MPESLSDFLNSTTSYAQQIMQNAGGSTSFGYAGSAASDAEQPMLEGEERTVGIIVKADPTIQLPEIQLFMNNPGDEIPDDDPEPTSDTDMQQTKITGIIAPLVKINDMAVPFSSVVSMELTCSKVPAVTLVVNDSMGLIKTFDKPRPDNSLQIQILPPFAGAYKKINLPFYITSSDIDGDSITLSAVYNIPGWHDNVMKAYGELTTYEFFEQVAKDYQLGFASNIDSTDDKRWIYVAETKMASALTQECKFGGQSGQVLDWWIDYWNNLNLVDVSERNNTIDRKEDMQVWILPSRQPRTEAVDKNVPFKTEAMVTNNEVFRNMQSYVSEYSSETNMAGNLAGTDRVVEFYMTDDLATDSYLLQDKDVTKNIYLKYDYIGENFGPHEYLLQSSERAAHLRKLSQQKISVDLFTPSLALARGTKVNFYWYHADEMTKNTKFADVESNIELPQDKLEKDPETGQEPDKIDDEMIIDKQISGQYYIESSDFYYDFNSEGYNWRHHLVLTRPADQEERFYWDDITNKTPDTLYKAE